jgi:hypothetical protein
MSYTIEQYNELNAAIATGALVVSYGGKTVTYRNLDDMRRIRDEIAVVLGLTKPIRRRYADFNKGVVKEDNND